MNADRKERRDRWFMTILLAGILLVPLAALGGVKLYRHGKWSSGRVRNGRRPTCKSNLRQIGLACHMWADDHDDRFPPDLGSMVPNYVDNPKVYSCPSAPSSWQDFKGGLVTEESSSYRYLPGRNANFSGDFFLAHDRSADNHGGAGFNVVYCDAHVEWWRTSRLEEFNKLLAAQEKVVRALNSDSESSDDYSDDYEEAMRKYRQIERELEGEANE